MQTRFTRILLSLALVLGATPLFTQKTEAAGFQLSYIRLDRMTTSTAGNVLVVIRPATVATEASVRVTMPSGFTVAASPTVNTTNLPSGVTALPGTLSAAGAGQVVTISGVTDLTVGTSYGVNIATGITNHASAGQYTASLETRTSVPATIDTSSNALRVIASDQIAITAVVPPTFSFSLSGNTDTFTADLDSAAVRSTNGQTVSVGTNAPRGWIAWVRSANAALSSTTSGESIATSGTIDAAPSTLSAGTSGYVLDADLTTSGSGSGSVTIDAEYNGTTTSQGGTLSTNFQPFASRSGKTAGDVITLYGRAAISSVVAAASDYTDTWTVVGAAVF